jgi:hypothetical protein
MCRSHLCHLLFAFSGKFAADTNRFVSSTYHRQRRIDHTVREALTLMKYVAFATFNPQGMPLWKSLAALSRAGLAGQGVVDPPIDQEFLALDGSQFLFDSFRDLIDFFKGEGGEENAQALKSYLQKRLAGVSGEFEKELLGVTLTKRLQHFSYWPGKKGYVHN